MKMEKEERRFYLTIGILAAVIGALIWANVSWKPREAWDVCIGMANARIEWTGAGYNGIYGR